MNAKQYLMGYVAAKMEIQRLTEIRRSLEDRADKVSGDMTRERVQSSKLNDQMATLVAKIVDNYQEIAKREEEAYKVQLDIIKTLGKIDDPAVRLILWLRYLTTEEDGRTLRWDSVAARSCYSEREVYRLHGKGLKAVDKIINEITFYADGKPYWTVRKE